jgi:hypothetical protein
MKLREILRYALLILLSFALAGLMLLMEQWLGVPMPKLW